MYSTIAIIIFFALAALTIAGIFLINRHLKSYYSDPKGAYGWRKTLWTFAFWICVIFGVVFVIAGITTASGGITF